MLDLSKVRLSFQRIAQSFDKHADIIQEIADRLIERLDYIKLQPDFILDLGSGTGYCAYRLEEYFPTSHIIQLDQCFEMVNVAHRKGNSKKQFFICGNALTLPFEDHSFDMIFSNLLLPWCIDYELLLKDIRRILKPNGLFIFTTLGPDTYKELKECFQNVDEYTHVHRFIDMHDLGDHLLQCGLKDPVVDMEMLMLTYRSMTQLMNEIKLMGWHNIDDHRQQSLMGKNKFEKVKENYEQFRQNNVLPATCEIIYGHAWGAMMSEVSSEDGVVRIPLSDLKRK